MKIEIFRSPKNKQWYFRLKSANHKTVIPSEGYHNRQDIIALFLSIREHADELYGQLYNLTGGKAARRMPPAKRIKGR